MLGIVKRTVALGLIVMLLQACGGGSSSGSNAGAGGGGNAGGSGGGTAGLAEANQFPQVDSVQSSNLDPVDLFGARFAIDGTTFVVSADGEDSGDPNNPLDNTIPSAGAAYVFELINNDWVETAYLKAPIPGVGSLDQFGFSVSISGDTIAVGVFGFDAPGGVFAADEGVVFIFDRVNGVWNFSQTLVPATTRLFTNFGTRVVIDGDTLITVGSDLLERRIIVFERVNGIWSETATLLGSGVDPNVINSFGQSLDLSGDTIVAQGTGGTYVFRKVGVNWVEQQLLEAPGGITLNGDRLLAGPDEDGTIFSYVRSDNTFTLDQMLTSTFPVPNFVGNLERARLDGPIDFDGTILYAGISAQSRAMDLGRGFLFQLVDNTFVNVGHVQTMLPTAGAQMLPISLFPFAVTGAVSFPFAIASGTDPSNGRENVSVFDLSSLP